ncbi:MAG: DEAD/DEAH box helicase [Anaerolineaceae bacterium]
MDFDNFAFHPQIKAGISAADYADPTPIQEKTIPVILAGKDVLGLAQTGTGKTAAFVLPILQQLMRGPRGKLRALILAPTRELAEQTHVFIKLLGRQTGLRSITVYGGVGQKPQKEALREGVDIVVACPGRLLDLKNQGALDLSRIQILVLDEADQMFDMGFLPSIRRIVEALPQKRQTLLFSATMPDEIRKLANQILHDPVTIEIGISKPLNTITHAVYLAEPARKEEMLLNLLKGAGKGSVLVFIRTKHRAKKLAFQLQQANVSATSLQGNLSQSQRDTAMRAFRDGKVQVLVATDIAARGIDVSRVSHVINYDLPDTPEAYTHRTGRTGRMERLGTALSLVSQEDLGMLRTIERLMGQKLELRKMDGFETSFNINSPALKVVKQTNRKPETPKVSRLDDGNPSARRKTGGENAKPAGLPQKNQRRVYNKNRYSSY